MISFYKCLNINLLKVKIVVEKSRITGEEKVDGVRTLFLPPLKRSYKQGYQQLFNRENEGNVDK